MLSLARLTAAVGTTALLALGGCQSMEASNQDRAAAARSQPSTTEQQQMVDKARITVETMRTDAAFGNGPDLLRKARAVVILPNLIKGGFFVGAEGGQGVMLAHQGSAWSEPAFVSVGSASFGLQIGLETAQLVMFVMSDRAFQGLLQDEFKLGAQAGITVVTLGSNVQGATTPRADADIVVWASSSGAYAGLTLEGSVIKPNPGDNAAYYGRPVIPQDILLRRGAVQNHGDDRLQRILAR